MEDRRGNVPSGWAGQRVEPVGYCDLDGRPAFKMSIREHEGRWLLYTGHFWNRGWSVVDVTDPSNARVLAFIPGPDNTFTGQMELSGNVMITALEKILPGFGGDPDRPNDEGVLIWDISRPAAPVMIGHYRTGGTGTHRNFYAGGPYMHLAAGMPGYDGNIYVIVDISEPSKPTEVARWWVPGQHLAAGEKPAKPYISLHGPAYVVGRLAYLPYGSAGMIVLDITDIGRPRKTGELQFSPPFKERFGVHTVLPVPEKGLAFVNSEDVEYGRGGLNHASIVDIVDPSHPALTAICPYPVPPPGAPYRDFSEKGGWSGPHNTNHLQHNPDVQKQGDLFYLAYFNAGLRIFDVADPRLPRETGYFIPPDPAKRYGPQPEGRLALQTEDVLVDRRGYIYLTDKNQGLWIVRYMG